MSGYSSPIQIWTNTTFTPLPSSYLTTKQPESRLEYPDTMFTFAACLSHHIFFLDYQAFFFTLSPSL